MRRTLVTLSAIGLLLSGCAASAQGRTMTVPLHEMNASGVSGTATLTEIGNGRLRVELKVNDAGNTNMPSHIHPGTCAGFVPQPRYPLENVINGSASSELAVTIDELLRQPVVVMTHKSNNDMKTYTSCGDIH